ncbi:MAG: antitoxin [Anaerobutyricum soehngenii]
MKDEYDFTKARKNPYAKQLKQQITINIDVDTNRLFQRNNRSNQGFPIRHLINLYLADCVAKKSNYK